jgi:hypothetical protein
MEEGQAGLDEITRYALPAQVSEFQGETYIRTRSS